MPITMQQIPMEHGLLLAAILFCLGLVGVRERVARLGGTLRLESRPGSGTRLLVDLPVPGA